ncbi:MAG TPA: glycosyltransferase, partial [Candidatus Saccharimonadales bacterium]|nr:glycosyltransferase [Candidatus Saccharimonadales bacterium]
IITQKNMGETRTVNKGLSLAKGEIIAVVNSDDPLLPQSIQIMVNYMKEHADIYAVYPDWVMIDGASNKIQEVHPINYDYLTMITQHYCIPGPGTFFRKKAIQLTGGRSFKFKYLADFAFWLKLGMYGPLAHIPKTLATFRVHAGSQGIYAKGEIMAAEHRKLIEWIYADKDFPKEAITMKQQAYSSAYFHAAKECTTFSSKIRYYALSFISSPVIFVGKIRYEGVKIKQKLFIRQKMIL